MKKKYFEPSIEMCELKEEIIVTSGLGVETDNSGELDENYGNIWQ